MHTNQDAEKIAALYALYEQTMFYDARAVLHDDYLAEDAVHEAFLRLIARRDKLGDPQSASVHSYVKKTLRSAAIDLYRKNLRERENCCDLEDFEIVEEGTNALPDDTLSLLDELPAEYAPVIRCRLLHGLSVHETAAILKISEACVRKRCERARRMLQDKLHTNDSARKEPTK